jgi:hypothetical protein
MAPVRRRHGHPVATTTTHAISSTEPAHTGTVHLSGLIPRFRVKHVSDWLISLSIVICASYLSFLAYTLRDEVAIVLVCASACIARFGMTGRWPRVTKNGAVALFTVCIITNCWSWIPWFRDLTVHKLTIGVAFAVHLARSGFYIHALLPVDLIDYLQLPHWRSLGADAVEMEAIGMPVYSWITLAMVIVVIFGRLRPEAHLENR